MNRSKVIRLCLLLILLIINGCDVRKQDKIGELTFPVSEDITILIDKKRDKPYRVYFRPKNSSYIPDEILETCKDSSDPQCVILELYGEMPWVLTTEDQSEIIKEGNYQSVGNGNGKVIPLIYFKADPGRYKLTFGPSKGRSDSAPEHVIEILLNYPQRKFWLW